ncbi:MAG: exodeoxyribonuclease VII small subunit [Ruminococcaceae bacterium]|nr:exodeoxyribonuclease VII small subunit [Oscillospiraceae bacterium]
MSTKKTEISFEENIKELESIVRKLEDGEVSLDEMLGLFEEGIRRTKECTSQLKKAEQKITVLMKTGNGEICEEPFEVE